MGEERQGGTEDERKSSTPDQSTALLGKRENSLTDSFLPPFLPLEIILLFSRVPFAWKKIQREREREILVSTRRMEN